MLFRSQDVALTTFFVIEYERQGDTGLARPVWVRRVTAVTDQVAWDNEDFVKAVKATGHKQIIIAGVVTDVCVAFPTLSALAEGFEVFVVTDASGTFNTTVQQAAWSRMTQAGAQLMNWFSVACELQGDWRNDMEGLGNLLSQRIPNYRNLMNGYAAVTARQG